MYISDMMIEYAANHCCELPAMKKLRQFNANHPDGKFQTSKTQAAFLSFLVSLTGAKRIIEYGVFTGYSAAMMAWQLPPGGRLYAVDVNSNYLALAEQAWEEIGVDDRISSVCHDALTTIAFEDNESFDMIYIDIDQMTILSKLYEKALRLIRTGGLIAIDNVLWAGEVTGKSMNPTVSCIQKFNDDIIEDNRVKTVMLPGLGDGLTLVMKI